MVNGSTLLTILSKVEGLVNWLIGEGIPPSADNPAKRMAGKFWFGRLDFGGVGKEKKLGSLEKRSCPHYPPLPPLKHCGLHLSLGKESSFDGQTRISYNKRHPGDKPKHWKRKDKPMTTEERLEKLEKELAQLARAATEEVIARQFVLVDDKGKTRAVLGMSKTGPSLALYDENGKFRATLNVTEDGPALGLLDEKGKPRAGLAVTKDGPQLSLFDENSKNRAWLAMSKNGPGLILLDENDKPRVGLAMLKDGPKLGLSDEKGKLIWSAP